MTEPNRGNRIYGWNGVDAPARPTHKGACDDESLGDGLQSRSVRNPTIEQKIEILHRINDLGIDSVNLGLPGAGSRAKSAALALATEIAEQKLPIAPN